MIKTVTWMTLALGYMLTRRGCLNQDLGLHRNDPYECKFILGQNSYECERLQLEYMQTRVYYNPVMLNDVKSSRPRPRPKL